MDSRRLSITRYTGSWGSGVPYCSFSVPGVTSPSPNRSSTVTPKNRASLGSSPRSLGIVFICSQFR